MKVYVCRDIKCIQYVFLVIGHENMVLDVGQGVTYNEFMAIM